MPKRGQNEEEKLVGLDVNIRAMHLRLECGMHGGVVGREMVFEVDGKPLGELLGELLRDSYFAWEDEQVGKACSTSKYRLIWEVSVRVCINLYIMYSTCLCV